MNQLYYRSCFNLFNNNLQKSKFFQKKVLLKNWGNENKAYISYINNKTKYPSFDSNSKKEKNQIEISDNEDFSPYLPNISIDDESFDCEDSILLDPNGPFSDLPRQKRAPPPESWDFKFLSEFEQRVAMNPYAAIIGSPIRRCFYHDRWFPNDLMVRFIKANDQITNSTWIVPDFVETGGIKRPGKGRWLKANSEVITLTTKEGKYKYIDNVAFWRPDMNEHIWRILRERATIRLTRFFSILPSRRFPARRDRVLLQVLPQEHFISKTDQSTQDDLISLHFIGEDINKGNSEEGEEEEEKIKRFYINNIKNIPGIQCVFILNPDISMEDSKDWKNESLDSESEEIKIPSKPFGAIHPVTYRVLDERDNFIRYETQFVPFYDIYSIWGKKGIARLKGFLKINYYENPMLGLVTDKNTKQLALSLWKLREKTEKTKLYKQKDDDNNGNLL
ncbi:hypothetical protein Glove_541g48 [Diversispora epigaea]|uniref:Uncharacterized protein n=1 Tax=Diversispora epigaea TaxID=1348612 RepID=A0A397GG83_9GLOM|nr:hypothetical protein Glove_541g48 [Diversispora epigaea]